MQNHSVDLRELGQAWRTSKEDPGYWRVMEKSALKSVLKCFVK